MIQALRWICVKAGDPSSAFRSSTRTGQSTTWKTDDELQLWACGSDASMCFWLSFCWSSPRLIGCPPSPSPNPNQVPTSSEIWPCYFSVSGLARGPQRGMSGPIRQGLGIWMLGIWILKARAWGNLHARECWHYRRSTPDARAVNCDWSGLCAVVYTTHTTR